MIENRVKIQNIVENQLPIFVREEFPLVVEFLKQYYVSQEFQGSAADLIQNIDKYLKLETINEVVESSVLLNDLDSFESSITLSDTNFVNSLPQNYGLLRIDDEIITYVSKTGLTLNECVRGFSGVTSLYGPNTPDELVFTSSVASDHTSGTLIYNLSILFLKEFLKKIKKQLIPGFDDRPLYNNLNQQLFITQSKDFYNSKGTDNSFKILFKALYGEEVEIIKPRDNLFRPSDAEYRITKDIVVEEISGNPLNLINKTIFQDVNENYNIPSARGSVTNVEKIYTEGKTYYKLSLDYDYNKDINVSGSILSDFSVHPKTKLLNSAFSGFTTLDVDSTIGFPNSGELITLDGQILTYTDKSINQFYNVDGITSTIFDTEDIRLNVFAYGYEDNSTSLITIRINSVLEKLKTYQDTYLYSKNDTIRIRSLGKLADDVVTNSLIYNTKVYYNVRTFSVSDLSELKYNLITYDNILFRIGDSVTLTGSDASTINGIVESIITNKSFTIKTASPLNLTVYYVIERNILKVKSIYSNLEKYNANIQNSYVKFTNDVLITSSSLPNYPNQPLNAYSKFIILSGDYDNQLITLSTFKDHGFYTGDSIYYNQKIYNSSNLLSGLYFIYRVDATTIKLATSKYNLLIKEFITVSGKIENDEITYFDFYNRTVSAQNIVREILPPNTLSGTFNTIPGPVGILINGVEILNYKSTDFVSYGGIDDIQITSPGYDYDVINPPLINISDPIGTGATGTCAVIGQLKRINIIDSGFDYTHTPIITITGGNGIGAKAEVNMTEIDHIVPFNAESTHTSVNLVTNTIGFSTYHKFRDNESVVYQTDNQNGISGLTTDANYYVYIIDSFRITLHNTKSDSITGINTVSLQTYGSGIHNIKATNKKQIISNIVVTNSGENYQNKKRITQSVGINTSSDKFTIKNHGYNTGETVVYASTGSVIGGLSTTTQYYVNKIDNDTFSLYNTTINEPIDITSFGSGTHYFNYPNIIVNVSGAIGVSTRTGQDFSAKIQPIFRGGIDSIDVTNSGVGYGSAEILNYVRNPEISFISGSDAEITPIINNGKISEILIRNSGSNYNSPPNIIVTGSGNYHKLTPIIQNGKLISINVVNGGIGFGNDTEIKVVSAGVGCNVNTQIQTWNVNLFHKNLNIIENDDGIIEKSAVNADELQYFHLYPPRILRKNIYVKNQDNVTLYGVPDLKVENNEENIPLNSFKHSPIIGWAYDGNPIYGPYGYTSNSGGFTRLMKSGYELVNKDNRPSVSAFPQGFFINDYEFKGTGDLDEHNGRFCLTPEFPNGTYAYFNTINPNSNDSGGTFNHYRRPVYPYVVGNTYKSKPNEFNFKKTSNQIDTNLQNTSWFRNTTPYNVNNDSSGYNYIINSDKQYIDIIATSTDGIQNIGIITGGTNYGINDRIIFDNSTTGGTGAAAKVSKILGKTVSQVSTASTSIFNIELTPDTTSNQFIGFSSSPHELSNFDLISISGLSTSVSKLNGNYKLGIRNDNFVLSLGIGSTPVTGIVTYFYISGALEYPFIRENDILQIEDEDVKVLNIDQKTSRIRVVREQNSTIGLAHSSYTILYENPRKFRFNVGYNTTRNFPINKEIYFDPSESVGVGTTSGIGIGITITFTNPGVGPTNIFVPTQSIYLPNHNIKTGEELLYSNNGGNSLLVSNTGISTFYLGDIVYATAISKDFLGISTIKVGLGTTGTYVGIGTTAGILYFHDNGTGVYHSLKTSNPNVVVGQVNKNHVTVSTAATHGLSVFDSIDMEIKPFNTTTVSVKYDDYNRRIIFDSKSFIASDVDITNNTIQIVNHGLITGDKVIHTSSSSSGGLENEKIYYVIFYDNNRIKLVSEKSQLDGDYPTTINITTASSGTISKINPIVNIRKNNTLKFDLSDSTLSFVNGAIKYTAFDFDFYIDSEFNTKLYSSKTTSKFEVIKSGKIGIDSTANVSIQLSDQIPNILYYKFTPTNIDLNTDTKLGIVNDLDVKNHNQINVINSVYTGNHSISGIGTTTFTFTIFESPESTTYDNTNAIITYQTTSETATGSISKINITNSGIGYKTIPGISSVSSQYGSGAILKVKEEIIGEILDNKIQDIGFNYPTDSTLRPVANLPEILNVDPLSSFSKIGISSGGRNYISPPGLIVIDAYTNKIIDDVDLQFVLGATEVKILKNTYGIYNTIPRIIPINNSNGVGIHSISYNDTTKHTTLYLSEDFSNPQDFPFEIGDNVLIENVNVGVNSTGTGYNSEDYNYQLFELIGVSTSLGGSKSNITYSLENFITSGETPGIINLLKSNGRVIPEKQFPIFDIELKKNNFYSGEIVKYENNSGVVESWNNKIDYLKVSTNKTFDVGNLVIGQSSNTQGIVKSKIKFDAEILLNSFSIVKKGWSRNTGFLNDNTQRLPDNHYYQHFSYALKSKVPFDTWNDAVNSLNHAAGFLKFSDLVIESVSSNNQNNSRDSSNIEIVVDIVGDGSLNCEYDFDLAREKVIQIGTRTISNEIILENRILTDYFESIGNRVLIIDDISPQFNSEPRLTRYSVVDEFDITSARTKKYFTFIQDIRYTHERQFLIVSLLHDGSFGYMNQYGRVETFTDLGSYDFSIAGSNGQLLFYPTKYSINDYNLSYISFDLKDTTAGIGTTSLGDIIDIQTTNTNISIGTTTTIVGIASTYRSSKILVEITGSGNIYEFSELNLVHDGTNINVLEYGQLTNHSLDSYSSSGLGTYSTYYSGSNINIDFIPSAGVALTANTVRVSIANTLATGIGTIPMNTGLLNSSYTSIPSSVSPTENVIVEYENGTYRGAYYLISVEDTTNNEYQLSEVVLIDDTTVSFSEFANLETNSNLGTIGAIISSGVTQLTFTPIANVNIEVRVFQLALSLYGESTSTDIIDLGNSNIVSGYGDYDGTETTILREFDLTHRLNKIFERTIDGSDSSIINTVDDTILIPYHYYVTGEKLAYNNSGIGNTQAIGIASTSFVGVGITDKLPTNVYAIKIDDTKIKLARSAEDALKFIPKPLDITSVGIGSVHIFTATNQNAKTLISLNNIIQSPIVSTAITTTLADYSNEYAPTIKINQITSFFGGDLIKIDDELMKIQTVGFGSTNVLLVDRHWMGTGISSHPSNSVVRKYQGNYNIVNNIINFVEAPTGLTPISSTTNPPNERDWIGISTSYTFHGRVFLRSGDVNGVSETYSKNYVFDDFSNEFTGMDSDFTLTSSQQNVTGFSTDNAIVLVGGVFQQPQGVQSALENYTISENSGISTISFIGAASSVGYDINTSSLPVGGIIVSVGSSSGFGYQPLVSAGGTAIVSIAGTISSISIGNSGAGYRAGIQTHVNVGVRTDDDIAATIQFIGTAAISNGHIVSVAITNPGTGYTTTNPPTVFFDAPFSYSNIPLIYSTSSSVGVGTEANIDIVVGSGSSIINLTINNFGYGYQPNEILTVNFGGLSGIPTDSSKPFEEFQILIDKTYNTSFSAWSIGQLQVLDRLDPQFDGTAKTFGISLNESPITIRAKKGSNIDIQATLFVFINNVLQIPGDAYLFDGGSTITFNEPPKAGDLSKLLFYKGSGEIDVIYNDILETIKIGDDVQLRNSPELGQNNSLLQDERAVTRINATDLIQTNPYPGPGLSNDELIVRPINWCRQLVDKIINGKVVGKSRVKYEPLINPTTYMIQSVGIGSDVMFVQNARPLFDSLNENSTDQLQKSIVLISQDDRIGAAATAIVSIAGTISSINISNGGSGYASIPSVTISYPIGIGSTYMASAQSAITSGIVTSISIINPGIGYTPTNSPSVLIESPSLVYEEIKNVSYSGDYGIIVGVKTTSVGVASTGIIFDLYIPMNSDLRNSVITGVTTISGIQTGYYFSTFNTNIGNGVTSLYQNSSILGISTQYLDNVYEVADVSIAQTSVTGIGITHVSRVIVSVSNYNSLTGTGYSSYFGEFSWGKIVLGDRSIPQEFNAYTRNGIIGLTTSSVVTRINPLKYLNYLS